MATSQLALETPLYEIVGARAPLLRRLEKLGVKTVGDLLWHFPVRYEDYSKTYSIAELEPGQQATIQGTVEEMRVRHSFRRGMEIVEGTIADETGSIRAVWFNQPYLANVLKPGRRANFAGKVSLSEEGELYLNHPVHEIIRMNAFGAAPSHTGRLVPVYPETRGLTSRWIRFIMQSVFKRNPRLDEWLPDSVLAEFGFPDVDDAIRTVHFPNEAEEAARAKLRFSFEELFLLQLWNVRQKARLAAERAPAVPVDIERIKDLLAALPFELTPSQKKSLWEITKDLANERPMNRLLQGDVGSGKTVVAAIGAIVAADHGLQTAFMAPTEILARQHFETMKKLFDRFERHEGPDAKKLPAIGLLTGTNAVVFYERDIEAKVPKQEFHKHVADGAVSVVFGTHALIEKGVVFKNLGFVIIDEQHRFGVRQRAELLGRKTREKKQAAGTERQIPHFLSMSATPIPRTLMLSVFGDLDLSLITELPSGRKPIETRIVSPIERQATYDFARSEIKNGRQAFVICPRIEPSEDDSAKAGGRNEAQKKLDLRSVKEEYDRLSKTVFPDLRLAMLHGQMKGSEKESVMKKFAAGEFDILVTTSVVEVGVDVPNATIMIIEGADRFGLAQLYQFRGRVGRGEHQSYCFLMAESTSDAANARLRAILEAKNGFELAERDLELRGPGQFFGEAQTGLPDIAMEALRNPELVQGSRAAALRLLQEEPRLTKFPALRARVESFGKKIHRE
ncbi:MAG TPA: ATP-dependent DNA helicase RecG [Candidatus Paceibacterota bacterium]|nr:ATP-dependent DNA helicase RecG [Candidatus Paceibacterota bacterium]